MKKDLDTMGQYGRGTANLFSPDLTIADVNSINLEVAELGRMLLIGE